MLFKLVSNRIRGRIKMLKKPLQIKEETLETLAQARKDTFTEKEIDEAEENVILTWSQINI